MEEKILMIVESPNKVKTIKQFLPSNIKVMASVGHITEIANTGVYNMGIDPKNNFEANYVVSSDKKDIVKSLKEEVKKADKVYLATDPDREGEAISWHLKNVLKIPKNKYYRITYHEITKRAILDAINNPRKIDDNLVSSAKSRQKLDKIIGYRLSGIARKNVGARSVGRCQSAGLKVIVEREEEILNFKPETYYELVLRFSKNQNPYSANYVRNSTTTYRFKSIKEVNDVINSCNGNNFSITNIENKERRSSPKPPFTTSTFQQEVSNKLGMSVSTAMSYAQKLFEGIDINGEHKALITYIRTDSPTFAPEFVEDSKNFVCDIFGKEYYAPIRKVQKSETSQDGHEAIRPVDLYMTPKILKQYISDERLLAVYEIIFKRAIACSMADAIFNDTIYTIESNSNKFIMTNKELVFDGYKQVYSYKEENEDEVLSKDTFQVGETLKNCVLETLQKETNPPKRYTESSFIKTLDKLGIGRPSTYASIVQVILDERRGYCELKEKKIVPTNLGINLSHFLDSSFSDIISIEYTATMEKSLDLIAQGKLNDVQFLNEFYNNLETNIKNVCEDATSNGFTDRVCPNCGSPLRIINGQYGRFYGCTNYPKCKFTEKL